jgi:putative transposase
LVLWPERDGQPGAFVRRLSQRHSQAWHRAHGTTGQGHLYQGRYRSFLVQADEHLLAVCRHVERNPLRARLVPCAVDWPHSSLRHRRRRRGRLVDAWPLPRPNGWAAFIERAETPAEVAALRLAARRGRPRRSQAAEAGQLLAG